MTLAIRIASRSPEHDYASFESLYYAIDLMRVTLTYSTGHPLIQGTQLLRDLHRAHYYIMAQDLDSDLILLEYLRQEWGRLAVDLVTVPDQLTQLDNSIIYKLNQV